MDEFSRYNLSTSFEAGLAALQSNTLQSNTLQADTLQAERIQPANPLATLNRSLARWLTQPLLQLVLALIVVVLIRT